MSFTNKSRKELFVEAFCGDPTEAARIAGYPNPEARGEALMNDPSVKDKLIYRTKLENTITKVRASRHERQEFWSSIMRNEDPYSSQTLDDGEPPTPIPLNFRLKASELLGRSEADFVERIEMDVKHSLESIITQAYQIPDSDIEEIEYEETSDEETSDETYGQKTISQKADEEKVEPSSTADIEDLI